MSCVPCYGTVFKQLLIRFTICSLCILTYCNLSYFRLWFLGRDFGSDCISSWSLITFYFLYKRKRLADSKPFEIFRKILFAPRCEKTGLRGF